MLKHRVSHSLAVLICSIVSAMIVEVARPLWPVAYDIVLSQSDLIKTRLSLGLSVEHIAIILTSLGVSLLWLFVSATLDVVSPEKPKKSRC